jgi:enterochelin esterase family protein
MKKNFLIGLSDSLDSWDNLLEKQKNDLIQHLSSELESQNYPLFESNSKVVLVYKGKAETVSLLSDITGWTNPIPFAKINGFDLFYLNLQLEPDARIQYLLLIDGNPICDPSNKFKCLHGLGDMSELAMPKYERHPYLQDFLYGKQGSYEGLTKYILPTGALPYEHEVYVYLPQAYNRDISYPTIYFNDGPDYIRFGLATNSLNRLINDGLINPCIAIFITPPNLHQPAEPNRSTEYGLNDDYVKFFCDELVYFIDQNYKTDKTPERRIVIGDSYAGLISFYIAFSRTDVFMNAYSQSGYFSFNNDKMIKLLVSSNKKPLNLYFDIGTYELKVGADFLPSSELDFTSANRRMRNMLSEKNFNFVYKEYHDGHTWGNWRNGLIDALQYFLRKKGT